MVFFFTGCAAIFYLLNIPICAEVCIKSGQPLTFVVGVGIFTSSGIVRKTYTLTIDRLLHRKKGPRNISIIDAGKYALKHLLKLKIDGKISLGTGDAAQTAQLCGLLSVIHAGLDKVAPGSVRLTLEPDFEHTCFYAAVQGMVKIKLGHIMGALFLTIPRRVHYGTASH